MYVIIIIFMCSYQSFSPGLNVLPILSILSCSDGHYIIKINFNILINAHIE